MVCFTMHQFQFNNTNSHNWFNLLLKYYRGVSIIATTDDEHVTTGTICEEFFQDVLVQGTSYVIKTNKFWAEAATIKCMPQYVNDDINIRSVKEPIEYLNTISSIDSIIESRTRHGGQEILLRSKLTVNNFAELLTAFSFIKNTQNITRMYISHTSEEIIIVLKDTHTITINKEYVGDASLPTFDVDEGFSADVFGGGVLVNEFNTSFQTWCTNFKESNGNNWDAQII